VQTRFAAVTCVTPKEMAPTMYGWLGPTFLRSVRQFLRYYFAIPSDADSRPLAYSQPDDPYTGWNDFGSVQLSDIRQTEFLMHTADRFLKFATECQIMAQLAPQGENPQTWNRLAERWLRCAELTEQLDTELRSSELRRRQKHLKIVAH
jgi:hypothetical protein